MEDPRHTLERQDGTGDPHPDTYVTMSRALQRDLQEGERRCELRAETRRIHSQARMVQSLIEGPAILGLVELVVYGLSPWSLVVVTVVGLGLGFLWHRLSPVPTLAALTALGGFFVVRLLCGRGPVFWAICAIVLIVCLSMGVAITRSSERMGA